MQDGSYISYFCMAYKDPHLILVHPIEGSLKMQCLIYSCTAIEKASYLKENGVLTRGNQRSDLYSLKITQVIPYGVTSVAK